MNKDPNPGRAPSAAQRRGARIRELDADELANVLGGTDRTRPKLDTEVPPSVKNATRGGFWRWLLG